MKFLPSSMITLNSSNFIANMHLFHHFRVYRLICAEIPSTTQLLLILSHHLSGRVVSCLRLLILRNG
jgi:hypothetical protein